MPLREPSEYSQPRGGPLRVPHLAYVPLRTLRGTHPGCTTGVLKRYYRVLKRYYRVLKRYYRVLKRYYRCTQAVLPVYSSGTTGYLRGTTGYLRGTRWLCNACTVQSALLGTTHGTFVQELGARCALMCATISPSAIAAGEPPALWELTLWVGRGCDPRACVFFCVCACVFPVFASGASLFLQARALASAARGCSTVESARAFGVIAVKSLSSVASAPGLVHGLTPAPAGAASAAAHAAGPMQPICAGVSPLAPMAPTRLEGANGHSAVGRPASPAFGRGKGRGFSSPMRRS